MADGCLMSFQPKSCARWNHFWPMFLFHNSLKTVGVPWFSLAFSGCKMGALVLKREIKDTVFPLMNASTFT